MTQVNGAGSSVTISGSQRFFSNGLLKNVNGKSPWGAVQTRVSLGFYNWKGLEPLLSIGFMKNSTRSGTQTFSYSLYETSVGVRYIPWNYEKFFLAPFVEGAFDFNFARGERTISGSPREKRLVGLDMGTRFAAGAYCSFFFDQTRKHDMKSEWEVSDFGMLAGLSYSHSGFLKNGRFFDLVDDINYWDFGLGLSIQWN